jgi:outer membrane protein TolC
MVVYPIHAFTPAQIPPFDRTLFQVLGEMSYTVFDGGARSSRIRTAQAEEAAAEEALAGTGQSLLGLVVGAYLEALGLAQALEAHDRSIAALESELSRVRLLFDVGRAAQIEILRVEAAIASAEAERVAVASSLDRVERNLARLTGASVEETRADKLVPVSLMESTLPPREELRDRVLSSNPSVQASRQKYRAAESGTSAARSARLPDVSFGAGLVDYASASGANQLEWNLGLRVSYPLFTGGAVGSAIARAHANERRAAEEVRLVELEAEQGLDRALSIIDEAGARVRSLTTAVRRFEEVVRIERLRLDTGVGTQTDYLRSEGDLLTTRASLIRAQYGVILAWTELARVTGTLDRDWVRSSVRNEP